MTASGATINGNITASSGKIAGYTIDGDTLYGPQVGMDAVSGGDYAFWAGAAKGNSSNAPFRVGHDGSLYASSATISGNITATSGTIGKCTINSYGNLIIPSGHVSGTFSASKISGGKLNMTSNGGGYLRIGEDTTHPEVSGLNITGGNGIAFNGNSISGLGTVNMEGGGTGQTGVYTIAYNFIWQTNLGVLTGVKYKTRELSFKNGIFIGATDPEEKSVAF